MIQRQYSKKRAGKYLYCTNNDPARPSGHHRSPPVQLPPGRWLGNKTKEIDLLANLRHQ